MTDDLAARVAAVTAELMGPGAPYEIAEQDVLGERMPVLVRRPPSLRELFSVAAHADAEHLVLPTATRPSSWPTASASTAWPAAATSACRSS